MSAPITPTSPAPGAPAPSAQAAQSKPLGETLLVEEYKSCRDLIKTNIDIIEKSEVYAVGAAAAAAVYCLSSTTELVQKAACWLPLVIAIIGGLRFVGIDATISKINNYLVSIEKMYPEIGWTRSYRLQNEWKVLKLSRYSIWLILADCGMSFGLYVWRNAPLSPAATPAAAPAPLVSSPVPPLPTAPLQAPAPLARPDVPAKPDKPLNRNELSNSKE